MRRQAQENQIRIVSIDHVTARIAGQWRVLLLSANEVENLVLTLANDIAVGEHNSQLSQ